MFVYIIYKCFYLANVHTYKELSVGGFVQSTQTKWQLQKSNLKSIGVAIKKGLTEEIGICASAQE
jgi:hypothetical protein